MPKHGRPELPLRERRDCTLIVRVTLEEKETMQDLALDEGLRLSEYLRKQLGLGWRSESLIDFHGLG